MKFRRCLFTSSIKHESKHFHVVVVQKRERNVQKKCDARAKLLFCLKNPIVFLTFSSPSASLDRKVPNYLGVTRNVQLHCPVNAEIRAAGNHSG